MLTGFDATLKDEVYEYGFYVYPIDARLHLSNVVYMFVASKGVIPIKYIGRASSLSERLSGHEQLSAASWLGADQLWVHQPKSTDPINYEMAEKRLIRTYSPPLNTQNVLT